MKAALVLVDLQNDFIHPDHLLGQLNFAAVYPHLLSNVRACVTSFRRRRLPVIWIRSEYSPTQTPLPPQHLTRPEGDKYRDIPMNTEHLAGSHHGSRPFCTPGSAGANFHPEMQELIRPTDTIITKTYYSGFTGTALHDMLQSLNIDTLFFGGVTATTCVRATATDAFFHGYDVRIIKSAVSASSPIATSSALSTIKTHYGQILHHRDLDDALFDAALPTLYYVNGSIPSWRVQLLLAEKAIAYNPRRLHVMTDPKETRLPAFAAINPRCKTPTLVDTDGTVVIESLAILQYLEAYYPTPFTPSVQNKNAYTTCVKRVQESENLHNVCEGLEYLFLDEYSEYERVIEDSFDGTMAELGFWEGYLRDHAYVAGDEFTVADCALWPVVGYLVHRGLDLEGEDWVGLSAYVDRINARPAESEAKPVGWSKKGKVSLFTRAETLKRMSAN